MNPKKGEQQVVIYTNVAEYWYQDGKLHRDNGLPAVIYTHGTQQWFIKGKLHRDNGLPAIIYTNGTQEWIIEGKLHRDNGLPAVIDVKGYIEWYQDGKLHRDNDLPAFISKRSVCWYVNGEFIKEMSREKYDKLLRLYPAIQLYRKKSAVENSSFYKKWNKSNILEPLLTGMIIGYM